jgi:hypothetical protein
LISLQIKQTLDIISDLQACPVDRHAGEQVASSVVLTLDLSSESDNEVVAYSIFPMLVQAVKVKKESLRST